MSVQSVLSAAGWLNYAATVNAASYSHTVESPANATSGIVVSSDGYLYRVDGAGTTLQYLWRSGAGVSSEYECRWTNTSGTLTTGTAGSWLSLASNVTFDVQFTTDAAGNKACTGTLEIRSAHSGIVLASASITITATVAVSYDATLNDATYNDTQVTPTNAASGIVVDSDGNLYRLKRVTTTLQYLWLTGAGAASDYECRWTNTSGTLSLGTAGSWLSCGSDQSFTVNYTSDTPGNKSCTGTLEIRVVSTGTVVATATITLTAQVDAA